MARKKADGKITKTDAVKAAVADGADNPTDGIAYIKSKFGLDVTAQQFSTYKSLAKKKAMEDAAPSEQNGTPPPAPKPTRAVAHANGTGGDSVALARTVKQLVAQYGADAVKNMTDVFAE